MPRDGCGVYLIVTMTIHEMRHHGEPLAPETIAAFPQAA